MAALLVPQLTGKVLAAALAAATHQMVNRSHQDNAKRVHRRPGSQASVAVVVTGQETRALMRCISGGAYCGLTPGAYICC